MHADKTLTVDAGQITVTDSYEGLESAVITINGGNIRLASSDDGINVASGVDGSGMGGRPTLGGGRFPEQGDAFAATGDTFLHINGGYIYVNAMGDGLDVNGAITMSGGTVIVDGPTQNMNGAVDYDRGFTITGGTLVAVGSAGMAQAPDTSSTQYSLLLNLSSALRAGALVRIQDQSGAALLTFAPAKSYQSIVFSSPEIQAGATYDLYSGGSMSGAAMDGLYDDGDYTAGVRAGSVTVTGIATIVGGRMR